MKISNGNSKVGPNISLVPVKDCANCASCRNDCYALKSYRQYPNVRKAWQENSNLFRKAFLSNEPEETEEWAAIYEGLCRYLARKHPRFFRIHVAGDFLEQAHVDFWEEIARQFPLTRFLAFTKRHDLDFRGLSENFTVILSLWPGMKMPRRNKHLRKAWMQDGTETRIPADAVECAGKCHDCSMCWSLNDIGRDVVFHKH